MNRQPQPRPQANPVLRFLDIRLLALVGFVVGIMFHACVVVAVLEDDSPAAVPALIPVATVPAATVTPALTVLPDRTDCEEIRGTQYRSASERQFFLENCIE